MRRKYSFTKVLTTVLATALLISGVLATTPSSVFAATTTGVVNASALNLREGASTGTSVLGLLRLGASVEIVETTGDWYKVTATVNGTTKSGYVYSSYITVGGNQVTSGNGVVNVSALNVRSAASITSKSLGIIKSGTSLTVTGTSGDWYAVNVNLNGQTVAAYVYKTYITMGADTSSSQEPTVSISGTGTVNAYALNVRSGASTSTSVVACIASGKEVSITGQTGDWYQISTTVNGKTITGYVYAQYITKSAQAAAPDNSTNNDVQVDTTVSSKGKINASALNVRTGASTSSSVVTVLAQGTVVTITSEADGWYGITATTGGKTITGYASAQYITKISDEEADQIQNSATAATSDEEYLLACLVYCESGNQSYEGQLAVANVVLNRVASPRFPNTIKDVIYQANQFGPAGSGSLARVLASGPSEAAKQAAKDAIAGNNNVEGYYFFNGSRYVNTSKVTGYVIIGDHTFYYY